MLPSARTASLAMAACMVGAGEFMLAPLLSPLAVAFGCSPADASWLISSHAIAYAVAAPAVAIAMHRLNKRDVICGALLLFALDALALPLFAPLFPAAFAAALLLRVLGGIAAAALIPSLFALIADTEPPQRRTLVMGHVMLGMTLGIVMGPVAAGFLAQSFGWRAPFIALGVLGIVILGCSHRLIPATINKTPIDKAAIDKAAIDKAPTGSAEPAALHLIKLMTRPLLVQLSAKAIWLSSAVAGYLLSGEILRLRFGLSTAELGLASSLFGLGLAIGNLAAGRLERLAGSSERALGGSLTAIMIAVAVFFLLPAALLPGLGALILWGAGLGIAAPVSTAILASRAGEAAGIALAVSESLNNAALMAVLPLAAMQIADGNDRLPLSLAGGLLTGLALLLSERPMRRCR